MKATGVVESVLSTQEKRDEIYAGFDKAIAALKSSKDSNAFQASVSSQNLLGFVTLSKFTNPLFLCQ
jgi:hypothetical protein